MLSLQFTSICFAVLIASVNGFHNKQEGRLRTRSNAVIYNIVMEGLDAIAVMNQSAIATATPSSTDAPTNVLSTTLLFPFPSSITASPTSSSTVAFVAPPTLSPVAHKNKITHHKKPKAKPSPVFQSLPDDEDEEDCDDDDIFEPVTSNLPTPSSSPVTSSTVPSISSFNPEFQPQTAAAIIPTSSSVAIIPALTSTVFSSLSSSSIPTTSSVIPTVVSSSPSSSSTPTSTESIPIVTPASAPVAKSIESLALSSHNTARSAHGANSLTWSTKLAEAAQSWANNCKFVHSGGQLGPFGENLALFSGKEDSSVVDAVEMWMKESTEYNSSNPVASHFTQVVWKATTQVGCAMSTCQIPSFAAGPSNYFVCEYETQGNVFPAKFFLENVE